MPREDDDDELSDDGGLEGGGDDDEGNKAYTMHCRMYENVFPEIDDVVMVQVRSIAEMGAYVSLLEYNNIEGMILLSELSRRRIRSINKLIRVGKQEVCMVLRVDKEKGYIDLSKRRVSPEDVQKCDERFQRSKAVHSILRHVSEVQHIDMEALYKMTAWPLYEKFGHAYEAFRAAITDPESIFNDELMPGLEPALKEAMLDNIKKRLTPTAVKIRADIEVTCFEYEGINAIKRSLLKGVEMGTEDIPIKIKLLLSDAIDTMRDMIKEAKGELQVKVAARAVDERDDKLLSNLMSTLEEQNREVAGDDDDDGVEGMGNLEIS
ncbi:MAG: hypothetical protein SGPRY_010832 [Prymnesium sp.]